MTKNTLKYAGKTCEKHPQSLRYASNNVCVDCAAEYRVQYRSAIDRRAAEFEETLPDDYRPKTRAGDRRARAAARSRGDTAYVGMLCRKCGTSERYTNRGSCIDCTRRLNASHYAKKKAPGNDPRAIECEYDI